MTQQTLNNGETGSVFRGKLNANFTELYGPHRFTTMVAGGVASTNATALMADVTAASAAGQLVIIPPAASQYALTAVTFTSLNVNIRMLPGATLTPDATLKTFSGKLFQATACTTRLYGFNVDGNENCVGCWRSDEGTLYVEDANIIEIGSLAIAANASHIGTYGFLIKDVTNAHFNRVRMSDFVAALDGTFANNSGKVNGVFVYESDNVVFDHMDFDRFYGEDCDYIHAFDERGYSTNSVVAKRTQRRNQMKGVIRGSRFRYTEGTRRVAKWQGGDWDFTENDVRPTSTFTPVTPDAQYFVVTGVTSAANGQVTTAAAHGIAVGQNFIITGSGMPSLDGIAGTAGAATATTNLDTGIDTSADTWVSGGQVRRQIQITGVSSASPGVVTTNGAHGFYNGQEVIPAAIGGTTALNGNRYVVMNLASTTFELYTRGDNGVLAAVNTAAMGAYTSGGTLVKYTDGGQQCVNLLDIAGSFEGNVKVHGNYIDARGFGICISSSIGPDNRMHAHHNTIVGSYNPLLRMNPESLLTVQTIEPIALYSIGTSKVSKFNHNRVICFVNPATPQGSNNVVSDNVFEDPCKKWIAAGTSTQKTGLVVERNQIITRTPGFMSVTNCATVLNNLGIRFNDNWLERDGNTTHSLIFAECTNASATGMAFGNRGPDGLAGFVGFKASGASVPNIVISNQSPSRAPVDTMAGYTSVGNVGTGTDLLKSYTISAGTLHYAPTAEINATVIEAEFFGTKANNANAKSVEFHLNAQVLGTVTMTISAAGFWSADLTVWSTGPSAQRYFLKVTEEGGVVTSPVYHFTGDLTESSSATMTISAHATATTNNDVVCIGSHCVAKSGRTLLQA